jgi:hypothetical protein
LLGSGNGNVDNLRLLARGAPSKVQAEKQSYHQEERTGEGQRSPGNWQVHILCRVNYGTQFDKIITCLSGVTGSLDRMWTRNECDGRFFTRA